MTDDVKWETFELKHDRAKELELEHPQEPTTKDCLFLIVTDTFGGVCSVEELWKITDIVYDAYQRQVNKGYELNKGANEIKIRRIIKK